MTRANLIYPPHAWWQVKAGLKHAAIKHMGAGPVVPGDSVRLHRWQKKKTLNESNGSKSVSVKGVMRITMDVVEPHHICLWVNSQPIPKRMARRLVRRCGYRSLKEFTAITKSLYGLPFYGQYIIF